MLTTEGHSNSDGASQIELRSPQLSDAAGIWQLVRDTGVLDVNSCYLYLLLCRDFAATSVVATTGTELCGFVTAYRPPERPQVLFVWQVGVAAAVRRQGLGLRMMLHLLSQPGLSGIERVEATIEESNQPSRRLFTSLADRLHAPVEFSAGFTAADFGAAAHPDEPLLRIGPIPSIDAAQANPESSAPSFDTGKEPS